MTITDAIILQQSNGDNSNFKCSRCFNYSGRLVCRKNIFILAEGANMRGCIGFKLVVPQMGYEELKNMNIRLFNTQ